MGKVKIDAVTLDRIVMLLMVASMLWLFPLYTENGFFGIQVAKLRIMATTLVMGMILLGVIQIMQPKELIESLRKGVGAYPKKIDIVILFFTVVAAFSTFLSPHPMEAFTGFAEGVRVGRVQGFLVLLMYLLFYLLISKKLHFKEWLLDGFVLFGGVASVLAVLNSYGKDPLGFYAEVLPEERATFISTIGNINTFSSLACMLVILTIYLYIQSKNIIERVIYGLLLIVNSGGLISAKSDSGLFAWIVMSAVMLLYFSKWPKDLFRFLEGTGLTLITFGVIGRTQLGIEGLWGKIGSLQGWFILLGLCLVLYIIIRIVAKDKSLRKVMGLLVGLGVLTIIVFMVAVNFFQLKLGGLEEDFLFGEHWGSGRMELYSDAITIFSSFDLKSQLIGYGPDTYGIQTTEAGLTYSTSTHSEYLQYLLTVGWLGLISYCIFIVSAMVMGLRAGRGTATVGLGMTCLAYSLQAIFNINQILTTPIFFILIAIMMSLVYRPGKEEKTMNFVLEKENKRVAAYDGEKEIGEMSYSPSEKIWIIDSTKVDDDYRGQKIGQKMLKVIVDQAEAENLSIMPLCPFAKKEMEGNEDYQKYIK